MAALRKCVSLRFDCCSSRNLGLDSSKFQLVIDLPTCTVTAEFDSQGILSSIL